MENEKEDNIITYETFRKFQKNERDNDNLQELPEDFFQSCAEWIKRKGEAYNKTKDTMILKEIENVMSIIKDILDRRERKLLLMAMHAVRSDAVPQNLHSHEEKHFDNIVSHLKNMRVNILGIIKGEKGETKKLEKELEKEIKEEEGKLPNSLNIPGKEFKVKGLKEEIKEDGEKEWEPEEQEKEEKPVERDAVKPEEKKEEKAQTEENEPDKETKEENKIEEEEEKIEEREKELFPEDKFDKVKEPEGYKHVRVIEDVPQFLGTDGKTYGPLKKDDIVTVEEEVAKLLVNKEKVEIIKDN